MFWGLLAPGWSSSLQFGGLVSEKATSGGQNSLRTLTRTTPHKGRRMPGKVLA
jgi:hypothetical protein